MGSNHHVLSLFTKGVLGGSTALTTKGFISDNIEIIVRTKRGSFSGGYDPDYWKRFRRDLDKSGDEIEHIIVKISPKYFKKKDISAELIVSNIEATLLKLDIIEENHDWDIQVLEDPINKAPLNKSKTGKIEVISFNKGNDDK